MSKLNIIHISTTRVYRYGIATFDWHSYLGPVPVRRKTHGERNYRNVKARWWADFKRWFELPESEKAQYEVTGE